MSKGLFSGLGAALSSGYGHSGYGHSGSGHSGYGHSGSSYGAIDKHSGYGGHQDHYGGHSGHSGYGHSGGYHEEKCCPLVVDFLCLAAILGAIAGAALLLARVIQIEIMAGRKKRSLPFTSYLLEGKQKLLESSKLS